MKMVSANERAHASPGIYQLVLEFTHPASELLPRQVAQNDNTYSLYVYMNKSHCVSNHQQFLQLRVEAKYGNH